MKLLFKQRLFSWLDSYDIYDEQGNTIFVVKGQLSWGHCLNIMDSNGIHIATVKEVMLTFLPKFELYIKDKYIGSISKELSLFKPHYNIDFNGWHIDGNFMQWDYEIYDKLGNQIADINREIWNFTDTYSIEIKNSEDVLGALMVVLAIDAEKCSRN